MKLISIFFVFVGIFVSDQLVAQSNSKTCLYEDMKELHVRDGENLDSLTAERNAFVAEYLEMNDKDSRSLMLTITIPVVIHVFHNGDDARLTEEQVHSGLEVLNTDINGRNADFNQVDSLFDSIKDHMYIEFCLASIDPDGNPTSGINYYDDESLMLNQGEVRDVAWDNFKYMNFYLVKYSSGAPSNFTAYAYFPSLSGSRANRGGVVYSSIRWGYGDHSELDDGQEWASVVTHEVGHWLGLQHTFSGGCGLGDGIADTPPTLGGTIYLDGCFNNDYSCGQVTNGSNYMDYNHDCKKMFTQDQVTEMEAVLRHASRITLWTEENLIATGCMLDPISVDNVTRITNIYPNPAAEQVRIESEDSYSSIMIYNSHSQIIHQNMSFSSGPIELDVSDWDQGLYYFILKNEQQHAYGHFIKL